MKQFFKLLSTILILVVSTLAHADYTLGAGDYVRVTVYGDADLMRETRVSEDGVLTMPLIGEVKVGGLTTIESEKRIAEQLKRGGFIANPQVSVLVLEFMSKTVSVLGGVLKPGRYPITRPTDVKDMLAEAGGLNAEASEIITVVRGDKRSEYDLHEVIEHRNLNDQDIRLTGGETIYVSMRDVAVTGQVLRPGKYGIQGGTRKISDFVALAGGSTEAGGETLYFTTQRSGSAVTQEINIDELFRSPASALNKELMPGDVIYVPKAPQVYIYGEVQRPGMYKIDKNMTVMQAIAKAGGLTVRGTQRSVKLHRKNSEGATVKQAPDLSGTLQDEDVLFIEESLL
ncbi:MULTISPECIES: SLBB domain-containing protein [unclassified Methylophilus]|jgi:polysaccharide biosynthesis/export protein|uniref:SLBB domain-containing protein n=1 Tax=unclassified Methylophilus TaxID=2630143 RepID=UPI0023B255AC|nr:MULTISPECIES: SLBB domain-containing protein [unclassified Methylophilus]MDF0376794.1 polysaccharide export protein [Methylophilus sp. YYY-1]MDT7850693.1 SLBB domain-containing protein [Methylophilus sp. VKM B-3414]